MTATAKDLGERLEAQVIDAVEGFEAVEVPDTWEKAPRDFWHDAVVSTQVVRGSDLWIYDALGLTPGDKVEIKATAETVSDGRSERRGRFYIRRGQHEQLLEAEGYYCFALYEPDRDDDSEHQEALLALLIVPASSVEQLRTTWYQPEGRPDYWQLSSSVLPWPGGDHGAE